YSALVVSLSETNTGKFETKPILQLLDEQPVVLKQNLELWNWLASYYCCTLGDIFRAALPSGLKLESKSKVFLTGNDDEVVVSEKEQLIIQQLNEDVSSLEMLQKNLGESFSYPDLKKLLDKNIIEVEERVQSRYKPKTETFVKLHADIKTEDVLSTAVENLRRAKKQQALLLHFAEKTNLFQPGQLPEIGKKELFEGTSFSTQQLNELAKKKILLQTQKKVSRIEEKPNEQININLLNRHQEKALGEIKELFTEKNAVLLHGITASGKTEIYIHLIDEAIKNGKQALYLVPEIALTTQIVQRLKNAFGNKVGIYHSRLNSQERVEIWQKMLQFRDEPEKGYQVILGARSAVFMPFSKLGLVIVDEEHENSFKQFDPAPRYNARDTAVVLAIQNNAKVLLGSATPSFESYYNAQTGKYGHVNLLKRHTNVELPEIVVTDLKRAHKKKQMHGMLAPELYELTEKALDENEQVILFQNRRGYSPFVQCFNCGWIPKCQNCDVSLTYHKYKKRLNCHYCGYNEALPDTCHECASPEIKTRGFGTEKIEDELKSLFRNAKIARMDQDSTRNKNAFEKIVSNLENRKTNILVGTQMVTKGLDFDHVSVVGILNADNLINFPDFRAHERAYQLISQVSGRAGRKQIRGKVVIQTSEPDHPIIDFIKEQDYHSFFEFLMEERRLFKYPPYYRLIKLVVKHKNPETVNRASNQLGNILRKQKQIIILGPEFPLVSKIQLWYNKEIWVKFSKKINPSQVKDYITQTVSAIKQLPENSNCIINIDVDPA
ncbi:MAG TPA: primosomal protein N', partial [Prolixibacteraceae bacterium]|nr:primosomal protein N' [Prolixibacteraceae bacterium]